VMLEQPSCVVAELLAERTVIDQFAIELVIGLMGIARRGGLEPEREIIHPLCPPGKDGSRTFPALFQGSVAAAEIDVR
jgi:hypothetical protein